MSLSDRGRKDHGLRRGSSPVLVQPAGIAEKVISVRQEAKNSGSHVIEHVEQVVTGVEDFEDSVRVVGGELLRVAYGYGIVVRAVEDERGLGEIGISFEAFAIGQELVAELAVTVIAVMKDIDCAGAAPGGHFGWPKAFGPALREAECRRQQDYALDLIVARGIEGGEVSAEARADKNHAVAGDGAVDHGELPGNCNVLEITIRQVRNIDGGAGTHKERSEVPGFRGLRSGGEAVEINDAGHITELLQAVYRGQNSGTRFGE